MLLRFSFSNYMSVREPQELSMIAGSLSDQTGDVVQDPGLSHPILRVAGIFGPNASGKSNVFHGLRFINQAIKNSQTRWEPSGRINHRPFALDDSREKPSEFSIDFMVQGVRYEYGFSLDNTRVLHEYLFAYPANRRQRWFERNAEWDQMFFGKSLTGENRAIENLTRANSLFLSAAAQNNHEKLRPIFDWLTSQLIFRSGLNDGSHNRTMELCLSSEDTKKRILRHLVAADLGIVDMHVEEEEIPTEQITFGKKFAALLKELDPTIPFNPDEPRKAFSLHHRAAATNPVPIPLRYESTGTLAYLAILGPAVEALTSGGVLVVDELDASLHPLLVIEFVKMFNDKKVNPLGAQLIFNAHATELLHKHLRRDQVWFTEKDDTGATRLYPLTHYRPRKEENIQRSYLQGRYGATPILSNLVSGAEE